VTAAAVGALAAAGAVVAVPTPAVAVANCPDYTVLTPGNPIALCSTSSYVDQVGITHILGELYNPGSLVESPAADVEVTTGAGTHAERVYPPYGWIDSGKRAPFDLRVPAGTSVSSFRVIALEGLTPVARPDNDFTFSNVVYGAAATDSQAVSGTVTNSSPVAVEGIKVSFTAYDAGGRIAYYQPYIVTGNNRRVQPGDTQTFSIPRNSVPPNALVGPGSLLFAEGNEPLSLIAGAPAQRALGTPPANVRRSPRTIPGVESHNPATDRAPAGVPAPGPSALAGFASPGSEPLRHDPKRVRRAGGPLPALVTVPVASRAPTTTAVWAPLLIVGGLGLLALTLLARQLAAFRGALAERREARRARAAGPGTLADGAYVAPQARPRSGAAAG